MNFQSHQTFISLVAHAPSSLVTPKHNIEYSNEYSMLCYILAHQEKMQNQNHEAKVAASFSILQF